MRHTPVIVSSLIRRPLPAGCPSEVEGVLISEDQIARGVQRLARQITRDFRGRDFVIVSLLNGTVLFLADLIRHLPIPLRLDFIGVSSYRDGSRPGSASVRHSAGRSPRWAC